MAFKTLATVVAALALGACNTSEEGVAPQADLAVEQAAPPGAGGLTLQIDGTAQPGTQLRFRISGAQARERVFLGRGTGDTGNVCPAALGGLCLQINAPTLMTTLTANAQGVATFTATVPANVPEGYVAYFQAATGGGTAATSNIVPKFNPLDGSYGADTGPGIMGLDLFEDAQAAPGSYTGTRSEIYFTVTQPNVPGLDACIIDADTSGTGLGPLPPCAGCDFAFALTLDNFRDGSISGDCIDLLDFDPTTIAAQNQGWGYDADYYFAGYGNYPAAMFYDTTTGAWAPVSLYVYFGAGNFQWLIQTGDYFWY